MNVECNGNVCLPKNKNAKSSPVQKNSSNLWNGCMKKYNISNQDKTLMNMDHSDKDVKIFHNKTYGISKYVSSK